MEFRIADTFTDSLLRLTVQEQKPAKGINRLAVDVIKVFKVV